MPIKFLANHKSGVRVISRLQLMKFPAGEVHIKIPENYDEIPLAAYVTGTDLDSYMALAQWADIAHQNGHKAVGIIPYLPGARQDRGKPFGAHMYANLINMAGLDQVIALDPHSHVIEGLVNNLTVVKADSILQRAIFGRSGLTDGYTGVIAPDKGAVKRAQSVADLLQVPVHFATKIRNPDTGRLSDFSAPEDWLVFHPAGKLSHSSIPEGRFLVVDDICDGGGTFMGLASVLDIPRENLTLWVSHGVFSGNASQLTEAYGNIYTTDSHPGASREDVGAHVTPLLPHLLPYIKK